ncbi:glycosyltransferase [Pseudomonas sp. UBA2684]|mgnify:FL=1|uniref:glycosyltransferase n=1 Tax=Pseudomonas sp. UBA2684 TaxID=1947311 RepID=UPI0025DA91A1|nr:glycosyltransferase [Pseudomonas sp. UBA2684]
MISFLMPVKNEAKYIKGALDSIVNISFAPVEVIVVDDGSNDGTPELVESFGYSSVKVFRTGGIGKAAAFSLAYEKASGDYFILTAGDDYIIPDVVEARVAPLRQVMATDPAISLCKLKSFSDNEKYDGMVLPKNKNLGLESGGCMAFNKAFGELAFPIPSMLANEDSWLVLHARFSRIIKFHVPLVGLLYRIHQNNSYQRGVAFDVVNSQMWVRQRAAFYFFEKHGSKLSDTQIRALLFEFSVHIFRYLGASVFLLLVPHVSFSIKVKALFHSNSPLYSLRERFYKFFSGR